MGKWIKRIIKILVAVFFIFVVWRVTFGDAKELFSDFFVTEDSARVYSDSGELLVYTHSVVDEISSPASRSDGKTDAESEVKENVIKGQFVGYGFYYVPETKELQITVRYNDTTESTLGDFSFYMYTVDTSGDPVTEQAEGVRYHYGYPVGAVTSPSYTGDVGEKMFYNYVKLVFEGVEIDENTNVVVSLCNGDDPEDEISNLIVHFAEQEMKEHRLTKAEMKALKDHYLK